MFWICSRTFSISVLRSIAALYALRAIRELGIPMKKSVRLILGSDEECGSGDLEYYYAKEQEAPYTFTPHADEFSYNP